MRKITLIHDVMKPSSLFHLVLRSTAIAAFAAPAILITGPSAMAQNYPTRPIRIVVASAPGGGTDLTGRNVARTMSDLLRSPVIVENRPGAGSTTGTDAAARATPDGYTLLVSSASSMVMNGRFAPAATPPAMVGKLRDIFVEVARDPDFVTRIGNSGGYVMAIPPQQQQQFLRREIERWGQLIRKYGVAGD